MKAKDITKKIFSSGNELAQQGRFCSLAYAFVMHATSSGADSVISMKHLLSAALSGMNALQAASEVAAASSLGLSAGIAVSLQIGSDAMRSAVAIGRFHRKETLAEVATHPYNRGWLASAKASLAVSVEKSWVRKGFRLSANILLLNANCQPSWLLRTAMLPLTVPLAATVFTLSSIGLARNIFMSPYSVARWAVRRSFYNYKHNTERFLLKRMQQYGQDCPIAATEFHVPKKGMKRKLLHKRLKSANTQDKLRAMTKKARERYAEQTQEFSNPLYKPKNSSN